MPSLGNLLFRLLDPRGRCDRRGLLVLALGMLAVEAVLGFALWLAGAELEGPLAISLKVVFVYIAYTAASKRLHDLGRSAWWILGAFGLIVAWCTGLTIGAVFLLADLSALTPTSPAGFAVIAATTVPTLGLLLWLHCAKGTSGANRYGPVPDHSGFSARPGTAGIAVEAPMGAAA